MAKLSIKAGSTSVRLTISILASTSTAGLGLTGLTGTSAGLQAWYYRGTGTAVPITLTTSSLDAAYTSGLFVEVNSTATGLQGAYRFDPPDACFASGANVRSCVIGLGGAANMAPLPLEVELTAWDNQDATAGGINNLTSSGTLGSVSNVRGTSTVILSSGTHVGAVIPVVQTASVTLVANAVGTASNANVTNMSSAALAHFFDIDAGQYSTASAQSVVKQIADNSNPGTNTPPTVQQIATAVWQKYGTSVVQLNTGVHTGAVIPIVQTASMVTGLNLSNGLTINDHFIVTSPVEFQNTFIVSSQATFNGVKILNGTSGRGLELFGNAPFYAEGGATNPVIDINSTGVGLGARIIGQGGGILVIPNGGNGYEIMGNMVVSGGITADITGNFLGTLTDFTTAAKISLADAFLDRNMALGPDNSGTGTGPRTVRQALRPLRNHWQVTTSGEYQSFKEDDVTISYAKSVLSTNTANLIIGLS